MWLEFPFMAYSIVMFETIEFNRHQNTKSCLFEDCLRTRSLLMEKPLHVTHSATALLATQALWLFLAESWMGPTTRNQAWIELFRPLAWISQLISANGSWNFKTWCDFLEILKRRIQTQYSQIDTRLQKIYINVVFNDTYSVASKFHNLAGLQFCLFFN